MAGTYTTRQGDAWDAIAHRVYGSVKYTGWLMENNHPHLDTFRLRAGVVLQTPHPPAARLHAHMPLSTPEV